MEGGGAHLGLSLTMSVFHHRRSFLCAGGRLRSRVPFSFACIIFVRGGSPWFVGLHLGSWAGIFGAVFIHVHHFHSQGVALVRGRSSSLVLVGDRLRSWAVMPFVWCHGGHSCSFVGGRHRGRSCRWWGAVVGSWWGVVVGNWWGVVASHWCVVVVGPRGRSWWSSHVVVSLLWLHRGSRWCV